jgi:hypothetical protein
LKTRAEKRKSSSQLGPARRSDDHSDRAPRCVCLARLGNGGENGRGRVVVQAGDGGAQLPKVELKAALRQAWG